MLGWNGWSVGADKSNFRPTKHLFPSLFIASSPSVPIHLRWRLTFTDQIGTRDSTYLPASRSVCRQFSCQMGRLPPFVELDGNICDQVSLAKSTLECLEKNTLPNVSLPLTSRSRPCLLLVNFATLICRELQGPICLRRISSGTEPAAAVD